MSIEQHLLSDRILVDVRSPCEFVQGHIPQAINIPLFTDDERRLVGIEYKKMGQRPAIEKGLEQVNFSRILPLVREKCISSSLIVYCARGGMRSASMTWLLKLLSFDVQTIEGGYKSFRRWALNFLKMPCSLMVLGGETGSGKTQALRLKAKQGEAVLDLEGLAHHRGSVFGDLDPQPTQEQFENEIALCLFQSKNRTIWVEDESRKIGALTLPPFLFEQMQKAPLTLMQIPLEKRLERCLEEYLPLGENKLILAIQRLQKRLGSQNAQRAQQALMQKKYEECGRILLEYYDKKYRYALSKRSPKNYTISE